MDDNIIPINQKEAVKKRIGDALQRYEERSDQWIDAMLELATALAEGRALFSADQEFGAWLGANALDGVTHQDRAALIHIAAHPAKARSVATELQSFSVRIIREEMRRRFTSVGKPPLESASILQMPKPAALAAPEAKPASEIPAIPDVIPPTAVVSQPVAEAPEAYAVPVRSKLRDMIGAGVADILHAKFRSSARMFTTAIGPKATNNHKAILGYLASRCQQPDYPADLLLEQTWTPQLLYPHLPKRLLASMPANLGTLYSKHTALVETERRFLASPMFGVTDPPLAAFNEVQAIYTSIVNARKGNAPDPAAIHRPTYGNDEGKPAVVIRGRQLWPAETGTGYRYDDLRCGWGLASEILSAFDERNATLSSRNLKLRHVMAWLGGYNSTGATIEGTLAAFRAIVQAYSSNASDVMRLPLPSMIKNGES